MSKSYSVFITREDTEQLEKQRKECLTDNDSPLDLLCNFLDLSTANDNYEYNMEYISEQEEEIARALDYETAFISSMSIAIKKAYKTTIALFDLDLAGFEKEQKEYYQENYEFLSACLQNELDSNLSVLHAELHKEYLHGDRSEEGIIEQIREKADFENISYDEKADRIDFEFIPDLNDEEEYKGMSDEEIKYSLLEYYADSIISARKYKAEYNNQKDKDRKIQEKKDFEQSKENEKRRQNNIIDKLNK